MVPNEESRDIAPLMRTHADQHGCSEIRICQLGGCEWSKTGVKDRVVQALLSLYEQCGVKDVVI